MIRINPQKIRGNWRAGWALDFHTESIGILPDDEFDRERTELGEAVFQLKYRYDKSKIQPIAKVADKFIEERFAVDGDLVLPGLEAVIPVPPLVKNRPFQPVTKVAKEIGKLLGVEVRTDYLERVKPACPVKNVENKIEQLHGAFAIRSLYLEDCCVLLVDDIYDSGTTLTETTKTLYKQGDVSEVFVLTLPRTRAGGNWN